jgi:excisionase family DNA binding protein
MLKFFSMSKKTISAKEVAELLGLSHYTVYQNARKGIIPAIYPLGPPTKPGEKKPIRFIPAQIEKYIKDNSNEH